MFRKINEKDIGFLEVMDAQWTRKDFENLLSIDTVIGYIYKNCFLIGLEIDGDLFIERFLFKKDEREEFLEELKLRHKTIHVDLPIMSIEENKKVDREYHNKILFLDEMEFECFSQSSQNQMVMCRMTYHG